MPHAKHNCRAKELMKPAGANGFWRKNPPERHVRQLAKIKAEIGKAN
jgi:hypothetical protein